VVAKEEGVYPMENAKNLYFEDISRHALFSRDEERNAFRRLERQKSALVRLLLRIPAVQKEAFRLEQEVRVCRLNVLDLVDSRNGVTEKEVSELCAAALAEGGSANGTEVAPHPLTSKKIGSLLYRIPWSEQSIARFLTVAAQLSDAGDNYSAHRMDGIKRLQKQIHSQKEAIAKANLRLVIAIAQCHVNRGLPLLDLIQEGNAGMLIAIDKFDYKRGVKFSTYASYWIYQSVNRAVIGDSDLIRLSVRFRDTLENIKKRYRDLIHLFGRKPTLGELAEAMELPVKQIQQIQALSSCVINPVSLDMPVGEDESATIGDLVANNRSIDPLQEALREESSRLLCSAFSKLTPREEKILRMRFGIGEQQEYTLEQVGDYFGLTRERIRQIERDAMEKIRQSLEKKLLRNN